MMTKLSSTCLSILLIGSNVNPIWLWNSMYAIVTLNSHQSNFCITHRLTVSTSTIPNYSIFSSTNNISELVFMLPFTRSTWIKAPEITRTGLIGLDAKVKEELSLLISSEQGHNGSRQVRGSLSAWWSETHGLLKLTSALFPKKC